MKTLRARATYSLDFIIYPVIALLLAALTCRSWGWVGLAMLGVVLFTLAEYWVHRALLHGSYYHSPTGPRAGTHEHHHLYPEDYVLFPIWYVPSLLFGFFLFLPLPVFAGFCLGYFWFAAWHHVLHHWELAKHPLLERWAAWHKGHHNDLCCNFGVTHPLWDVVFRTYRRRNA